MNTILSNPVNYDIKNIRISDPINGNIPDTKIVFKRMLISTINPDGTEGELVFPTEELFSFGVNENTSQETGKVNGYVMSMVMHNKNGATPGEKALTDVIDKIVNHCKQVLVNKRVEIEQYDLDLNDLKRLSPLYPKKINGKIVPGGAPSMYVKLLMSKKDGNKIKTYFFDENQEPVDPLELVGKYCYTKAAIKVESIFVGSKISLQFKLYEAEVRVISSGPKRLLSARPATTASVVVEAKTSDVILADDDEDDEGSLISEESDDPVVVVEAPPVKTVVKKVIKKVSK